MFSLGQVYVVLHPLKNRHQFYQVFCLAISRMPPAYWFTLVILKLATFRRRSNEERDFSLPQHTPLFREVGYTESQTAFRIPRTCSYLNVENPLPEPTGGVFLAQRKEERDATKNTLKLTYGREQPSPYAQHSSMQSRNSSAEALIFRFIMFTGSLDVFTRASTQVVF